MERLENVKSLILLLLPLCFVSAVVAFFLPAHGMIFTCITIALATVIGALCLSGLFRVHDND
ncbi:MAG: hypothetical protein Q3985_03025 [Eubacteriales bacterium]|nr:hypothetical protein [Eubacteriales bacterium]